MHHEESHSKKTRAGWHYIVKRIANRVLYIILTKVAEIPEMLLPLEIFKDYTISCFKGNTKIYSNDLINSFIHKIETFSQI